MHVTNFPTSLILISDFSLFVVKIRNYKSLVKVMKILYRLINALKYDIDSEVIQR